MTLGIITSQPIGHHEFCQVSPTECNIRSSETGPVVLTDALWSQLVAVNDLVNDAIVPATDMELFGQPEVWAYPATRGDCEDYVLLKQRMLADIGWPISALLITVVRRPDGEGHAVLTVRTDQGDLVLDNLERDVRLWGDTAYAFIKRQSEHNTGRWIAVEDGRAGDILTVGGP